MLFKISEIVTFGENFNTVFTFKLTATSNHFYMEEMI